MILDNTKNPPVFTVSQNVESQDTFTYTVEGSNWYVISLKSYLDTVHIASISSTQMEIWEKSAVFPSGGFGFYLYTWYQR